ncbi:unnamed protein product [Lactuca saligna]|uniref:Uncharacterized protein n=1 Tax=Lactuca saligna TaxID=75948 RepID=A0AA36A1N6_LACSI|nr:unnamed protein product [Lactuca saligna]
MHEPNITLPSYQSTKAKRIVQEDEPNDDDIMVSFSDLQLNPDEDSVLNGMIMSEMNYLLMSQEIHLLILKLRDVSKEGHDLFVQQLTKMKEYVDLKMAEIKLEMATEVEKMEKKYTLLHRKVDVIATAITKLVEFNIDYSTKLEEKSEKDSRVFVKLEEFLSSIKESILKVDLLNSSLFLKSQSLNWFEY